MILITGGLGYIGSHTCVELLQAGHEVVILDNLINSSKAVLSRIQSIAGMEVLLHVADIRDAGALDAIFKQYPIDAVIHFAGLKAVGESVQIPLHYYDNNVHGTLALLQAMQSAGVKTIVFSSSATVYGAENPSPYSEDMPISRSSNPYGQTKIIIENILEDLYRSDPHWRISILRYFNPIGAHQSGLIGENPRGIPNNICPYIAKVANGELPHVNVFGKDYPTPDGTGIRDYIHVCDLASGHLSALEKLKAAPALDTYNLGTGRGISVLELISFFEQASKKEIPFVFAPRREGDLAIAVANPEKAAKELLWRTKFDILTMCEDSWRYLQDSL